jgi:hypothetical protein
MFDPDGAERQKEKMIEDMKRQQEHQAVLVQQREAAGSLRTGSSVFAPISRIIHRNQGLAAIAETFDDRTRGRTIFGIAVRATLKQPFISDIDPNCFM